MSNLNTEQNNQEPKTFLLPFLINLMTLLSVGFIAGSIVHVGFNSSSNLYYIIFGVIGCVLFVLGNYLQEKLINKNKMGGFKAVTFLLVTLLLSISVGMISGGLQHFLDFPIYATYLIPLGIFFSTLFYMIKNEYKPLSRYLPILVASLLLSAVVFVGSRQMVETVQPADHHGSNISENTSTKAHDMSSLVTDEKSFIENMIPHHQEAINTSILIQNTTQDTKLKDFAATVIKAQEVEAADMDKWYKQWFSQGYTDNGKYQPMMTDMNSKSGQGLDKAYIKGMVEHHQGAIDMSNKALTLNDIKPETKKLAQDIMKNQASEITQLKSLLQTKFQTDSSQKSIEAKKESHDDGHTDH